MQPANEDIPLHGRMLKAANVAYTGNFNVLWIRYPSEEFNFLRSHGWTAFSGVYAGKETWMKMERPK